MFEIICQNFLFVANKTPAVTFPPPTTANVVPTVAKDESESDNNVNEEEVEIKPEDTGGKPTEDPDYGTGTEEDPHAVKEWRTWVDSGDEKFITTTTSKPQVITTVAINATAGMYCYHFPIDVQIFFTNIRNHCIRDLVLR